MPKEKPKRTDKTDKKQKPWLFKPGQSGNPDGRPPGSISVVTVIKQILQEKAKTTDGKERERLETLARNIVHMAINQQDKDMIKLIVGYIDGLPKSSVDFTSGGKPIPLLEIKKENKEEK